MKADELALKSFTATKRKVNRLFSLKKIALKDIEGFNKLEREYISETATKILKQLEGDERDAFLNKIELIIPASTKNQLWEYNHVVISSAISKLMREHGCMPPKNAIAIETGLSRQTISKHFAAYQAQPEYATQMEQFKFMSPRILATVFKLALNGDMKAARLYFETVGALNKRQSGTVVNSQNNYIQINNTIVSQDNLSELSPEQLNQIENIITAREEK